MPYRAPDDVEGFESWTKLRSKLAYRTRFEPNADHTDLRRELRASRLAEHIRRVVDQAPPLTEAQRQALASVLLPDLRLPIQSPK